MALRGVPWAIGGGAHNPVEGARLSLYAATQGARGVVRPTDMLVTALPVPGGAVRVRRGAAVMPNDYAGAGAEAYAIEETSYTDFPVPATGSSGGATRYLVGRVSDPQFAGDEPASVEDGPYSGYEWLTQDPATTPPSYPWVQLARINQPASTATITQDMITDIRQVANPRRHLVNRARPSIQADTGMVLNSRTVSGEWFPGDGDDVGSRQVVCTPEWATAMVVEAGWLGVRYQGGRNSYGKYWLSYGPERGDFGGYPFPYRTQDFPFDGSETGGTMRANWLLSDYRTIHSAMRGVDITFAFMAALDPNAQTGGVSLDARSGLYLKVDFMEVADPSTS